MYLSKIYSYVSNEDSIDSMKFEIKFGNLKWSREKL